MSLPDVVSRDEWRAARLALLHEEKAMTKARDALSTTRRMLPMVRVDKEYRFAGPDGPARLVDLFADRRQLVVQHFMFDPGWEDGCPSCTAASDEISGGLLAHLHARDTTLAVVSRAPLDKLHVSLDASVAPVEFNFRTAAELEAHGMKWLLEGPTEQPGYSTFLAVDGEVFHTYSTFGHGTEWLGGSYAFLDLTALGRQEEWEEPKGRADRTRGAVPDFST
jgi:predicted dithiol-disulfide oxidoreductase (DUF899 family)